MKNGLDAECKCFDVCVDVDEDGECCSTVVQLMLKKIFVQDVSPLRTAPTNSLVYYQIRSTRAPLYALRLFASSAQTAAEFLHLVEGKFLLHLILEYITRGSSATTIPQSCLSN